jgi:hypothetical protein
MRKLFFLFLLLAGASKVMQAQITWNFGTAAVSGVATNLPTNITSIAAITQVQNSTTSVVFLTTPALGTPSVGYTGASGSFCGNAFAKAAPFLATTSTYLQVVLTPATSNWVNITAINWGNLSVTTGPTTFTIFSSVDNYTTPIGTASTTISTSTWSIVNVNMPAPVIGAVSTAVTLRIFGSGGTGTPSTTVPNWRVDDIKITATAQTSTATVGRIPRYTGATTFTNSIMAENNGKIGIGTVTPATTLDVNGITTTQGFKMATGAGNLKVLTSDADGIGTWQTAAGGGASGWNLTGNAATIPGTNFIGTTDAQRLVFKTSATEKATILPNGNFGIGTATPTSLLHLPLSGTIAIGTPDISTTEGAALSSSELRFRTNTNFNTSLAAVPGAYELQILDKNSATALGGIRANLAKVNSLYSMNNFIVANVLDGQLKVGGNGYGGVPFYVKESGATPDYWADMVIEGSKTAAAASHVPLNLHMRPVISMDNATTGISFGGNNIGGVDNSNTSQAGIYVRSSNAIGTTMKFATTNAYANGAQMRMTINPIGNVGIGTETPTAKLDIAGAIKITDGSQGANKVLTSDANGLASWANAPSAISTAWGLQGNAGTTASNFIGTTDDQPLMFRLNNLNYGLFDHINNTNFLGQFAGSGAANLYTSGSNFLGKFAGNSALFAGNSNFLGTNAGTSASNANNSNFLGQNAGAYATSASSSNFLGNNAGNNATNADRSNFLGNNAGNNAGSANNSNFLGEYAGAYATNAYFSNFIGNRAGNNAASANNSNFLGFNAGTSASNADNSNFLGQNAGAYATSASSSNFFGERAGINSFNAAFSNFLGNDAGSNAAYANNSNFLGKDAGNSATNANNSNFLGKGAGNSATNASFSNFLGFRAGAYDGTGSMGENNIVIGTNISLPAATANAMNIGGVLFGTGFYFNSNPYGLPSSEPIITGKIGIGTSTPAEKLDVMGSVYANDKIFIGTRGDGTPTNPALTPTQLGGNYKLFVNGSAIFTKAVVRLTSTWADYVFEPTYKLPTLSQVEAYITNHKHLEGVPSAAEVKEKGIDLGDNQTILLKKVEELTLYMIELNKKVEVLAKENEELKKKVNGGK